MKMLWRETIDGRVRMENLAGILRATGYGEGFEPEPLPDLPPRPTPTGGSYYVALSGDDSSGTGTMAKPWRTIQHGIRQLKAGDALYIKAGTYRQGQVRIDSQCASGTKSAPILIIGGWSGDTTAPVIDGEYTYPSDSESVGSIAAGSLYPWCYGGLISISGGRSWYTLYGIEIKRARGDGVRCVTDSEGWHFTNCHIHDCRKSGLRFTKADFPNMVVEYCTFIRCEDWRQDVPWQPHAHAVEMMACDYGTFQHNLVHDCFGEGLIWIGDGCVIRDNIIYDTGAPCMHLQHSDGQIIERNLFFQTKAMWDDPNNRSNGISLKQENSTYRISQAITNATIRNNIIVGCARNIGFESPQTGAQPIVERVLIANNTFIDSVGTGSSQGNIFVNGDIVPRNVKIQNNIFVQNAAIGRQIGGNPSGIDWDYNCWWPAPDPAWRGSHDLVADPRLADPAPGPLITDPDVDDYRLLPGSPCVGAGQALASVTRDYWQAFREAPYDIGAHQLGGIAPRAPVRRSRPR